MANNPFLEEFVTCHPGDMERRLADAFDGLLPLTDAEAVVRMKATLDAILQERIDATRQD